MTPQEQQLLQGLAQRVNSTVVNEKDPEAEQFIQQALCRNPDAMYLLAQTVLVQQYALDQAKQQLDQAKQQLDQAKQQPQPQKHTSFLGSLLGRDDEPQRPAPPPPPAPTQYAPVTNYAPPLGYAPQPGFGPQYGMPPQGGIFGGPPGGGGFLRSAVQTAGGIAAGALAFEGIESLLHGFGQHAGYGSSGFGSFGGGEPREEVVNNYYGDSAGERGREHGLSPDIEDRRDASREREQEQGRSFADSGDAGDFDPTAPDTDSFDDNTASAGDDFNPDGNDDSQ